MVWIKRIYLVLCNLERLLELSISYQSTDRNPPGHDDEVQDDEEWMEPHQVRDYLNISESTYHRYQRKGILVGCRFEENGKLYYRKRDIDRVRKEDNGKWKR